MKYVWLYYVVDTIGTFPQLFSSEIKARAYLSNKIDMFEKKGCVVVNYDKDLFSVEDMENNQIDHIGITKCLVR